MQHVHGKTKVASSPNDSNSMQIVTVNNTYYLNKTKMNFINYGKLPDQTMTLYVHSLRHLHEVL